MCVANSVRSQIAEGLARHILGSGFQIESAGIQPYKVNPYAVKVMAEIHIDISHHYSKTCDELPEEFLNNLHYIITLCEDEVCPRSLHASATKLHWPFPDSSGALFGDPLHQFRLTRDSIKAKIEEFKEITLKGIWPL